MKASTVNASNVDNLLWNKTQSENRGVALLGRAIFYGSGFSTF